MSEEEIKPAGVNAIPPELLKPKCCTSEELKLFAGAWALVVVFAVMSYWIVPFQSVAAAQFGAIVGAAAMRMRGS